MTSGTLSGRGSRVDKGKGLRYVSPLADHFTTDPRFVVGSLRGYSTEGKETSVES